MRPKTIKGRITSNTPISPRVNHLTVALEESLEFKSGQFGWLAFERDGEVLRKPYSIASAPWEKEIALCVTKVEGGKVSPRIHELAIGDEVTFLAPLGTFTLSDTLPTILFIAAGSGIAPFRGMIRELFQKSYSGEGTDTEKQVSLLFGTRDTDSILYQDEFNLPDNFHYHITLSRARKEGFLEGYVQHHIEEVLVDKEATLIYICGLSPMIRETKKKLLELGVPNRHIHVEIYT